MNHACTATRPASAARSQVNEGQPRRERLAVAWAAASLVGAGALVAISFTGILALTRSLTPNPWAKLPILLQPALPVLEADPFIKGRAAFIATCATCHGPSGTGVTGLGKDLTRSPFVCDSKDGELVRFLKKGREASDPLNTTRVPMPPKGGNPNLTDDDLQALVVYMRGLQDVRRVPDVPAYVPPTRETRVPTEADKAVALEAAGGDAELAEWIAHGTSLFASGCANCHGADAKGMPGLGKSLVDNTFIKSLDDDGLLAFIQKGRGPSDPANTTKIAMPPKGGNPALSEDDMLDIIAYLRTLQPKPSPAK